MYYVIILFKSNKNDCFSNTCIIKKNLIFFSKNTLIVILRFLIQLNLIKKVIKN